MYINQELFKVFSSNYTLIEGIKRNCIVQSFLKGAMEIVSIYAGLHCASILLLHFCLEHNSKAIQGILLKLHEMIKDLERKCSIQEP